LPPFLAHNPVFTTYSLLSSLQKLSWLSLAIACHKSAKYPSISLSAKTSFIVFSEFGSSNHPTATARFSSLSRLNNTLAKHGQPPHTPATCSTSLLLIFIPCHFFWFETVLLRLCLSWKGIQTLPCQKLVQR